MLFLFHHRSSKLLALSIWASQLEWAQSAATKEHGDRVTSVSSSQRVCEDYLVGRQYRDPFPNKSTWKASNIFQLVHVDICGPITPISNNEKRYLITFIDGFNKKNLGLLLDGEVRSICHIQDLQSKS